MKYCNLLLMVIICCTSCTIQRNKPKVRPWPTKVVSYCFLDEQRGSNTPMPQEYRKYVHECAEEWSSRTDITLVLKAYSHKNQPDIVISMEHLPRRLGGWAYFPSRHKSGGDISIDIRDWDLATLRRIILHEFGHALGLGHSRYKTMIMYKHPRVNKISQSDVNELNEGYGL